MAKKYGPAFWKEHLALIKYRILYEPALFDCLAKQKGNEAEIAAIQKRITMLWGKWAENNFSTLPLGPLTFAAEDNCIALINQKISNLRKMAKGELMAGHTYTKKQLQQVRYAAEDDLILFISSRIQAIDEQLKSLALADQFKSAILARRAELKEHLLAKSATTINGLPLLRIIAADYIAAYKIHKTGPQALAYVKRGAGFARRAVERGDREAELLVRDADKYLNPEVQNHD